MITTLTREDGSSNLHQRLASAMRNVPTKVTRIPSRIVAKMRNQALTQAKTKPIIFNEFD